MRRRLAAAAFLSTLLFVVCAGVASAQYDYGRSGSAYGGAEDAGIIVFFETILTNPRNADNVVASNAVTRIIPVWDDDLAGRIGLGYQWSGGRKLVVTLWSYRTDVDAAGSGFFELPIGPTTGATSFVTNTEIRADTVDAALSLVQQATDSLDIEWSAGLRYASFEETTNGLYNGSTPAFKRNEAQTFETRISVRGTYRLLSRISLRAGLGLSFLDAELEGTAAAASPTVFMSDDGRSGTILDSELTGIWHSSSDNVRLAFGWEQSVWDEITSDLVRNPPGTTLPLRDRDSITFSGFKAGVHFRF